VCGNVHIEYKDAGKGVCSLIIPDELRPIALESNEPIDLMFNAFSVYSRMNLGQVIDSAVAKTVKYCDQQIRQNPDNVKEIVGWLNDNVVYHLFENKNYYNNVKNDIVHQLDSLDFRKKFVENVNETNLFIEAPCFSHIDMKNLNKSIINPNESILIKKEMIQYMKDRLKLKSDFTITSDVIRENIFCVPMYVNKLFKMTKSIMNTRDFGMVTDVTQQPVRGRSRGGGSRLGQMEIEGLLAAGCDQTVKELLTVKSDRNIEKRKLVREIIETGDFNMSLDEDGGGGQTKKVISVILDFLKE